MSIYFDFKTINELIGSNYYRQINQDTSNFTPDDWILYITPLENAVLPPYITTFKFISSGLI